MKQVRDFLSLISNSFGPFWAVREVMEKLILLKYPEDSFFYIFMDKSNKKFDFLYIVVSALKSWEGWEKCQFQPRLYFLCENRLKNLFLNTTVEH